MLEHKREHTSNCEIGRFRIFAAELVLILCADKCYVVVATYLPPNIRFDLFQCQCDAMSDKTTKCPVCHEFFDRLHSLHLHCVENHPTEFICCPICYQPFKTQNDFVKHSNSHHGRLTKENALVDIEIRRPDFPILHNPIWCVCF